MAGDRYIKAAEQGLRLAASSLKDEGLVCPKCGFTRNRASDGWCWSCGVMLPADWWRQ